MKTPHGHFTDVQIAFAIVLGDGLAMFHDLGYDAWSDKVALLIVEQYILFGWPDLWTADNTHRVECSRDSCQLPVAPNSATAGVHDRLARALSLDVAVVCAHEVVVGRIRFEGGVARQLLGINGVICRR